MSIKQKEPTLMSIKKDVRKIYGVKKPASETNAGFITGVVLLSSLVVGPNVQKIAKFTGYTPAEVSKRSKRCREIGLWVEG
jgi:hypothetical protein